jgi:hypothetical protein
LVAKADSVLLLVLLSRAASVLFVLVAGHGARRFGAAVQSRAERLDLVGLYGSPERTPEGSPAHRPLEAGA